MSLFFLYKNGIGFINRGEDMNIQNCLSNRIRRVLAVVCFFLNMVMPADMSFAQTSAASLLGLPPPGVLVNLSPGFAPPLVKGITIHPDNVLQFDFIIDSGNSKLRG